MVRIIIAGSRDFKDFNYLEKCCLEVFYYLAKELKILSGNLIEDRDNVEIISGCARGADTLGEAFAEKYGLKVARFPADWDTFGRSAGYIRNEQMAKYAVSDDSFGILISFWDGKSRGTKNMIDLAKKYGLKGCILYY